MQGPVKRSCVNPLVFVVSDVFRVHADRALFREHSSVVRDFLDENDEDAEMHLDASMCPCPVAVMHVQNSMRDTHHTALLTERNLIVAANTAHYLDCEPASNRLIDALMSTISRRARDPDMRLYVLSKYPTTEEDGGAGWNPPVLGRDATLSNLHLHVLRTLCARILRGGMGIHCRTFVSAAREDPRIAREGADGFCDMNEIAEDVRAPMLEQWWNRILCYNYVRRKYIYVSPGQFFTPGAPEWISNPRLITNQRKNAEDAIICALNRIGLKRKSKVIAEWILHFAKREVEVAFKPFVKEAFGATKYGLLYAWNCALRRMKAARLMHELEDDLGADLAAEIMHQHEKNPFAN